MKITTTIFAFTTAFASSMAVAKNVDLSTVPPREQVQLTIYNSEDLTLVRESRSISVKQGVNPLQFSWANTLIDPTSVDIRFKTNGDKLEVLDTTFPHDKPQMLSWNVHSEFDGETVAEISYFTSGISWKADYICISNPAEEQMRFDGFVQITNNSGEDYEGAEIRMVVGTINLVERVADLARRGLMSDEDVGRFMDGRRARMSRKSKGALRQEMEVAFDAVSMAPKEIVKEGLSEYFIFTVPGTETVRHQWSKRMRLFNGIDVPFKIAYRFRLREYGQQLTRLFLLANNEDSNLGSTPLPDGVVRVYRENRHDALALLAEQSMTYVPIGQTIELNLGADPEVVFERIRQRSWRDEFWFHRQGAKVYFSPTQGHRIKIDDTVVGWNDHQQWVERIRNYRDKPIDVEIRRSFAGHAILKAGEATSQHDNETAVFTAKVAAGQRHDLPYEIVFRQGSNREQNGLTLVR
ncbi:MAG: DUF4139 domain-containing protein [Planctomycetota bacterium]